MNVTDAVESRRSVRAFLPTPVPESLLREVLATAARSPSGGNLQPWRLYVLTGQSLADFRARLAGRTSVSAPEYAIYPPSLGEPYRTQRYVLGEQMYALLGVPREDKAGRAAHFARNFDFFGAPAALFCYVDRTMGAPQWSDLGMFLQTVMLLLRERGLDSCAQECWSVSHKAVGEFLKPPPEWMLFCGMAIGHADPAAPVNQLRAERMPVEDFAQFLA